MSRPGIGLSSTSVALIAWLFLVVLGQRAAASDVTPSEGPAGGDVTVLWKVGDALYAGTGANSATDSGGRLFKSSDDGITWSAADVGMANVNIRGMASHGVDLYVATSEGVYKSSDGGAIWNRKVEGLTQWNDFAIAATSDGDVYVGTHSAGVFKSSDGADHWAPVNTGVSNLRIQSLLADGNDVYAGTDGHSAGVAPQVYKTTDGGVGWSPTAFPDIGNRILTLLLHGGVIYAGVHQGGVIRTGDGGTSWEVADTGIPRQLPNVPASVVALSAAGDTLYAGHFAGVVATTDGGDVWSDVSSGLFVHHVSAVSVSGTRLLAGTISGVWASENGGSSWALSNTRLHSSNIFSLYELEGGRLLAGAYGSGVFLSDDGGRTWRLPNAKMDRTWIRGIGETATHAFASDWANGVLRSVDDGENWSYSLFASGVSSIATVGSDVYVAWTDGVYRTVNGGDDWDRGWYNPLCRHRGGRLQEYCRCRFVGGEEYGPHFHQRPRHHRDWERRPVRCGPLRGCLQERE